MLFRAACETEFCGRRSRCEGRSSSVARIIYDHLLRPRIHPFGLRRYVDFDSQRGDGPASDRNRRTSLPAGRLRGLATTFMTNPGSWSTPPSACGGSTNTLPPARMRFLPATSSKMPSTRSRRRARASPLRWRDADAQRYVGPRSSSAAITSTPARSRHPIAKPK
jgi:hypothetical protein